MPKDHKNFQEFVAAFDGYSGNRALTIRRFIKLESYNYADLRERVYQAANYLRAEKIQSGDRIMLIGTNSPEWVIVFLAAQILGIVTVNVDVASTETTIRKFADITEPSHVFCSNDLSKVFVSKTKVVKLESIIELISPFDSVPPKCDLTGNESTVIVFTSGTTADPKGVVLTQRNILSNLKAILDIFDINPSWQFLSVLPLSHMYELTIGCLLPLYTGGGTYYIPRVTPLAISKAMKEYHITVMAAVPQLGSLMMQKIEKTVEQKGIGKKLNLAFKIAPYLPRSLRRVLFNQVLVELGGKLDIFAFGGAAPDQEMLKKWELMGVKAVQGYGLTETSPLLAGNVIPKRRLDSQGMILNNIDWKQSEEGELLVRGPSVFAGYYKNPEATKAAFDSDGYFKTGDIGKVDPDRWFHIIGRAKFAIVLSSGLKVFPEDVELVAQKNEVLKNICVVGVKSKGGESVEAVILSDKSDDVIESAISEVNSKLESFQHIDHWTRWIGDDFPRTRLLKIERKIVQAWSNDQGRTTDTAKKASEKVDDPIDKIILKVLDRPSDGFRVSDKLADIGLDSLRRLMLVSMIEEELGVAIAESAIDQKTILADLRKLVASSPAAIADEIQPSWQYNPVIRFFGDAFRNFFVQNLTKIWVKWSIKGKQNLIDLKGPALIVFNHVDFFDIPLVYSTLPKSLQGKFAVAAAKDVLVDYKSVGVLGRFAYGCFGLSREEPILPSIKFASDLVTSGWSIAIAPEGKISLDGKLQDFKSGIGLLAVELGVPVICVATKGLNGTMNLGQLVPKSHRNIIVSVSKPIIFDKNTTYDNATKKLHDITSSLINKT